MDSVLWISLGKSRNQHHLFIALAIPIGISGKEDVRRASDDHSIAPSVDPCGVVQAIEKHGALIHYTITVGVDQGLDTTSFRTAHWIVSHLDHPNLTVFPPSDPDRIGHKRLACNEFEGITLGDFHRCQRLLGASGLVCGLLLLGQLQDTVDDFLLGSRLPASWLTVIEHRAIDFVATFVAHPFASDIREDIIDIASDPNIGELTQLFFEADLIVDNDLSPHKDPS